MDLKPHLNRYWLTSEEDPDKDHKIEAVCQLYEQAPTLAAQGERALRPSVIARKISGGTRSQKGSQTRCVLRSLFASWKAQGRDVMDTSQQMLTATLIPLPP